jgi:tRNA nucleotidyltransferase (CCA-adding enzyme)
MAEPLPSIDERILTILAAIRDRGGRGVLVGGWVRDQLLGLASKDIDIEVSGLPLDALHSLLASFGEVVEVGRAFGVLKLKHLDVDFSLPRTDSKVGPGHRGFDVQPAPGLDFPTAARRRDLTINSIGFDPLAGEYLDPHGGRADLERGILRATDPAHFAEDPLRAMRAAQFAARFEMRADAELIALCRKLDLDEVAPERRFEELRKLLLKGKRPSLGLELLRECGLLRFLPELAALIGVPQDPTFHPEGDVWTHTLLVVDEAALLRDGSDLDMALMLGALCHDFGKPATTAEADGRIRSHRHDHDGAEPTRAFLARFRAPNELGRQVEALVQHHLAPAQLVEAGAGQKAYRRLARKLAAAGVNLALLARVARADHLGRTTEEARARSFPAGDEFLARARAFLVEREAPADLVTGKHLIARGLTPGPDFGTILARCRELQDEGEFRDAERILDEVLCERRDRRAQPV